MTNQENQKSNTFAQLASVKNSETEKKIDNKVKEFSGLISREAAEKIVANEISIEDFSDVAVGDKVKYVRPMLNNTEDVVEMFQVFMPDEDAERKTSKDGKTEHIPVQCLLTYASKNDDGLNNREYISGARVFIQRDGSFSDINFWYKDPVKPTQLITLWELVAKTKKITPDRLSPREFVAFLNSKPKVRIVGKEYDNFNAPKGAPKTVVKNMPGEFLV